MKLKFLATALVIFGTVFGQEFADEHESLYCNQQADQEVNQGYGYLSLGAGPLPIPLPVFGGGYRFQHGRHGGDISVEVSTVVVVTQVKANCIYLHYFKPSYTSEFYVGVGPGIANAFGCGESLWTLSPEFVFGKQYRTESNDVRFFQSKISFPTIDLSNPYSYYGRHHKYGIFKFPLVTFSYGWGF